jgi:pimeloyl-ACP methyl ester carboxylesterase
MCSSDPDCRERYPELEDVFYQLVDDYNAEPLPILVSSGGAEYPARVDGGLLVDVLFVGLYNPFVASTMPRMIYDLREGRTGILREMLELYFDHSSALGMNLAVQCAEELPFSQPDEAFQAAQGVRPAIAAFFPTSVQPLFEACQEWSPASPDPRENQPVTSQVPALVLAGAFDPITPPSWGEMVAARLENAYFYELPANGHWVTRSSACALAMALDFWENPASDPVRICLQFEAGLDFTR